MQDSEIKVSRHETPDIVKVEFVGRVDAIMVSMRGDGVARLSDDEAVKKARSLMESALGRHGQSAEVRQDAGLDQTLDQP